MALDKKEIPTTNDKVAEDKKKKRKNKIYRYPSNIGSDEQPHAINFFIYKTESSAEVKSRNDDLAARVKLGQICVKRACY